MSDQPSSNTPSYTYEQAGVSIEAGNALVKAIGPLVKATMRPGADGEIGGFGGFFDPKAAGYKDPLLVAGNDGVGTKLKLAIDSDKHDTVGIDLVAMCVNDLIVQGAEPLFFLDYFATSKLDPEADTDIVVGIAEGCRMAGCALIGGETAELPGLYAPGDYDLAGFAVGAAERGTLLPRADIAASDVVLGLASDGVHANGYSLVRKVFFSKRSSARSLERVLPGCDLPLGETLLEPTRIYVKPVLSVLDAYRQKRPVHAISHITGGGLIENIPRCLPGNLNVVIQRKAWKPPAIFTHLAKKGKVPRSEMYRVFNMGIGMVLVVSRHFAGSVLRQLQDEGEPAVEIGEVVKGKGQVKFK